MVNLGLIHLVVLAVQNIHVNGFGIQSCSDLAPADFSNPPQTTPPPYVVEVSSAEYQPGVAVKVDISFSGLFTTFTDFILVAYCETCTGSPTSVGQFLHSTSDTQTLACAGTQGVVIAATRNMKISVMVEWMPPAGLYSIVVMRASIVKSGSLWWRNIDSTPLTRKESQNKSLSLGSNLSTSSTSGNSAMFAKHSIFTIMFLSVKAPLILN